MLGVLNIINKYFWKSWSGPFFTFIIAPIIMIISMSLFSSPIVILANALSIPIICTGVTIVPQTIFEFKSSVILKRIGVTDVKPILFMTSIFIYFTSFMIVSVILNLLISMLYVYLVFGNDSSKFGQTDFYSIYNSADYLSWTLAQLLTIFLSLSIGFVTASILKSVLAIQTAGLIIIIGAMFVGGALVPFSMVANIPILKYLAYLMPFRYTSALGIESWFANINNLFHYSNYQIDISQFNFSSTDTQTDMLIKIAASKYGSSAIPGHFVLNSNTGNYVFEPIQTIGGAILPPDNEFYITFIDSGKGFVYQTSIEQLKNTEQTFILPTNSLFNFQTSNIWQINNPFMQVVASMGANINQSIPEIQEIFVNIDKILSFVMPFVFMGLFFGTSTANFKWNSRG